MPKISVTVNGRNYSLLCGDGEEDHLRSLAKQLDREAVKIANQNPQATETHVLLLAALLIADEANTAQSQSLNLSKNLKELQKNHDSQNDQNRTISDRLTRAAERVEALTRRFNPQTAQKG